MPLTDTAVHPETQTPRRAGWAALFWGEVGCADGARRGAD